MTVNYKLDSFAPKANFYFFKMYLLKLSKVHPSWQPLLLKALHEMDNHYLQSLQAQNDWLPGLHCLFAAFSLPLNKVHYILFGESPYPRAKSANGYAFWDNAVQSLWSEKGLSKEVNRATSLRNFIKMLLLVENLLTPEDLSQAAIARIPKNHLIVTAKELFENMQKKGILLLNASLVLSSKPAQFDAKKWQPFMNKLLILVAKELPQVELILFGHIAKAITSFEASKNLRQLKAEHPYNLSFILNKDIQAFFKPLHLLEL